MAEVLRETQVPLPLPVPLTDTVRVSDRSIAPSMIALIGLAVAIVLAPFGNAACAAVDIQATLGFSNTFTPGKWTPLTVTLNNQGDNLSGYVEVWTRDGEDFRENLSASSYQRRIDLTRDSRKRLRFTVRLTNVAHPLIIRVIANGKEIASKRIDLRKHFTNARLLLVISRDANLDYLNDGHSDGDRASLRVLYPHPELLPDHWQGYDAVSAVILHGISLEQLSPRQYAALRKWIAQGGTLAASGGADFAWLRTPRMVELLPAVPVGMVKISAPGNTLQILGRRLETRVPFHVNRLSASDLEFNVHAGDIPLVAESRLGLGRVVLLTFDVARAPFDRWPGMKETWFELLHISETPPLPPFANAAANPINELLELQSRNFPQHSLVLLFLTLYLGVLATGYRLKTTSGTMRYLLPFAGWAAPVLFAPAAWFLFGPVLFDRGTSVAVVAVIEPLGNSPYARVQIDLGIHANRDGVDYLQDIDLVFAARVSAHQLRVVNDEANDTMTLSYAGSEPALHAAKYSTDNDAGSNSQRHRASSWIFRGDAPRTVTPSSARRYTLHQLKGEDVIDFRLHATIDHKTIDQQTIDQQMIDQETLDRTTSDQTTKGKDNEAAPRVNIHNNSGRSLDEAWLIAGDRAWWIGDIAAQGITRFVVDTEGFELNSRNAEWWERLERHPSANAANILLIKSLLARKDADFEEANGNHATYPGLGNALIIANTVQPLRPAGNSASWQQTTRTVVLLTMRSGLLVRDESTVTDL